VTDYAGPTVTLNSGAVMPQIGFGVWRVDDPGAERAVSIALSDGYRSIDTASLYRNEDGVGRALRSAAADGVKRDDVFITTKLGNPDQGYDSTLRAFDASAGRLGLEVVDLYLIHWPRPQVGLYVDTWKAMIRLRDEGRIRTIGVSNFEPEQLDRLVAETGEVPAINQVELHPYFQQRSLRDYHDQHGIITEAWAPLGANRAGLLDDPVLAGVAERNRITPAQAILAWHLGRGIVVIPKSVTPSRIAENLAAQNVSLSEEDLAAIDGLDRSHRTGMVPAEVN
jgi:diketogulonate reductase-like aldo/keto reductase